MNRLVVLAFQSPYCLQPATSSSVLTPLLSTTRVAVPPECQVSWRLQSKALLERPHDFQRLLNTLHRVDGQPFKFLHMDFFRRIGFGHDGNAKSKLGGFL